MTMSVVLQDIVVGVLVAGCALFSAWRLATVRARLRLLEALTGIPQLRRTAWLARLHGRTRARSTAACGGCSPPGGQPAKTERRESGVRTNPARPGGASPNRTPGALRR
jgi:hypothetical protein